MGAREFRSGLAVLMIAGPLAAQQAPPPPQPPEPVPAPAPAEDPAAFMKPLKAALAPPAPESAASTVPARDEIILEQANPQPPQKGMKWTVGDFTWKFGGYIKVDLIHDFNDIGSTDSFDVRTIPTTGEASNGSNTRLHARQTRFNMDVAGPIENGDQFHAFVEGDFFGDGNSFRMRHAYGELAMKDSGTVLAGQTWTTFMDDGAMPETLDFESPVAFPQIRQTQVRWSEKINDSGDYWAVAVEDPANEIIEPTAVTGVSKAPYPDLTGRVHWENKLGHVQLGLFAGKARFEPDNGTTEDATLWGFNLATKLMTQEQDNAIAQLTYGDGVGRYRGGVTAAPNDANEIQAVPVLGCLLSYQHFWTEKYRSSAGYSWANATLPGGTPATGSEHLTYGFVNLIYQFSYRAWYGVEFLHGTRQTADNADGDANRLQFSIKFDI
jgi:hypothetical protein